MRITWSGHYAGGSALAPVVAVIVGLGLALAIVSVGGLLLKCLWNWLMPSIFGLRTISFWEAVGLCVLGGMLFNGGITTILAMSVIAAVAMLMVSKKKN